ncbi:MAG TPA: HEAT repeat domain-containing protein [Kofleriaceae bacterium]|nr:HEAT repeat domain-containing protein [Kofleriaceae bacterium]
MSNDGDKPKPAADKGADKATAKDKDKAAKKDGGGRDDAPAAQPAPAGGKLPAFDERRLKYEELAPFASQLDRDELVTMARDGRAIVRGNAALGLAAVGVPVFELVPLLRDSDPNAAAAGAEAISRLGARVRELIPQIAQALDGAQPDVTESVVTTLSELVGQCDEELVAALDVPLPLAMKSVVAAAGKLGKRGIQFLIRAAQHERSRVRMNAIGGLGHYGKIDADAALGFLETVEAGDPVPDVRTAAKQAMLAVVAREKVLAVDQLPKHIPDFEDRKLSASELREYSDQIKVDEMMYALQDGRAHVKINAARALAVKGGDAARAAKAMGLLLRDSVAAVRREVAVALGKLGQGAIDAAPDLVGALGDAETDVAEAAFETLEALGPSAQDALVRGLDAGAEAHGLRVGALLAKLSGAAETLTEAFKSPAVNVQVNAALGLGQLGKAVGKGKLGGGLTALHGARTGGDARTREAVRRALEMIDPKGDAGPQAVAIEDFEGRFLALAEVEKHKAEAERVGVADLTAYLQDGRDIVRANAALALAVIGAPAQPAARSLGVRLRDDSAKVRLAAAQALDRIGDAAVIETADDLVGALRDADDRVAETCANVLKARRARMIGALVRGLETDDPRHGRRIVEVINALPDASEILVDAFESPAVNVQVNAAIGLGMLGPARVGKGRKALEGARTGGWERTREAVRKALDMLDGPRQTGPAQIDVAGFETQILGAEAFKDPGKLRVEDLAPYLTDGRAVVRANAATALGALGAPAIAAVRPLGVLLRDDDMRVRIAAAQALDKLGDDAVREIAEFLVGALRGDADVAKAVAPVLAARKTRVLTALLKGLETDDETHARRILEVVNQLPDACEILCDAIESPAENVQVNAAIGIGMLGSKRAGTQGRKNLESRRTGGFARTRESVFKALAMLDKPS